MSSVNVDPAIRERDLLRQLPFMSESERPVKYRKIGMRNVSPEVRGVNNQVAGSFAFKIQMRLPF